MGLVHSPNIVTNGLVLCLDAGNRRSYPGSGTTWYDLSGQGNHGTLINNPIFNASNNGILAFDGINQYAKFQKPIITTGLTLSLWINLNSMSSGPFIISAGVLGGYSAFGISPRSGGTYFEIRTDISNFDTFSSTTIHQLNTWDNIFAIWNNGTINIGINGIIKYRQSGFGSQLKTDGSSDMFIAQFNTPSIQSTSGKIASTLIYNRALSQIEIQQNFNSTRGRFGL